MKYGQKQLEEETDLKVCYLIPGPVCSPVYQHPRLLPLKLVAQSDGHNLRRKENFKSRFDLNFCTTDLWSSISLIS